VPYLGREYFHQNPRRYCTSENGGRLALLVMHRGVPMFAKILQFNGRNLVAQ